jgi:hypothetical protein
VRPFADPFSAIRENIMRNQDHDTRSPGRWIVAAALAPLCAMAPALAAGDDESAQAADEETEALQAAWRDEIARAPLPAEGCFEAEFPATDWVEVACVEAPDKPYIPRTSAGSGETVGNGHDYAASVTALITNTKGSFPTVTGVTHESDQGASNVYSLQLNSDFMHTARCNHHPNCLAWQQFIYSSGERAVFMQYWLINWDAVCPAGWNTFGSDCWKNSAAVAAPQNSILNLSKMTLYGSAAKSGSDKVIFTGPSHAYSTTGLDSVVFLATAWRQSEFNIVGDGGGSEAVFNSGSHVTVRALVHHGSTGVLSCASNAGTTGETNNLNLGACTVVHGSNPYIQFTESN